MINEVSEYDLSHHVESEMTGLMCTVYANCKISKYNNQELQIFNSLAQTISVFIHTCLSSQSFKLIYKD